MMSEEKEDYEATVVREAVKQVFEDNQEKIKVFSFRDGKKKSEFEHDFALVPFTTAEKKCIVMISSDVRGNGKMYLRGEMFDENGIVGSVERDTLTELLEHLKPTLLSNL